ncbi:protein of unknown function (DU1801) [Parasphingorhabdus marina DSM 22363]|uniref:YdhG-like domain-containing protein n=1 Tax=Parasphingorhabdus marina DSM 22363 TaxID=1123272 RepID=A0A1N6CNK0_9SPHN|nr:DUF1801 domain-containing protein [Parasphingorhabdus marina]SIN60076.1 protein of unknown function (DU1801) [Parasphingorhabdus marina DSM 22363]
MTSRLPAQTAKVFAALPENLAERLTELRHLILDTASENAAVGPLEETLKWGEPAFLPSATKSGTTIRINQHKGQEDLYALYVHCQTDLADRYRQLYGDILDIDGNRAIIFRVDEELPVDAVRHCIALALTCHLK